MWLMMMNHAKLTHKMIVSSFAAERLWQDNAHEKYGQ
jgi:hypothetical protein